MGRWTQYDEDDYRLPEGMKRTGYDADSGRYYFRDAGGSNWVGPQGAEFGEMTRVTSLPSSVQNADGDNRRSTDDLEASPRPTRNGAYELLSESESGDHARPMAHSRPSLTSSYRTLFPFFLIIAVVLLLIWRLILAPSFSSPAAAKKKCPEGTASYWIQPGESCWELARQRGWSLAEFKDANVGVVCDPLMPGTSVCVPPEKKRVQRRL